MNSPVCPSSSARRRTSKVCRRQLYKLLSAPALTSRLGTVRNNSLQWKRERVSSHKAMLSMFWTPFKIKDQKFWFVLESTNECPFWCGMGRRKCTERHNARSAFLTMNLITTKDASFTKHNDAVGVPELHFHISGNTFVSWSSVCPQRLWRHSPSIEAEIAPDAIQRPTAAAHKVALHRENGENDKCLR